MTAVLPMRVLVVEDERKVAEALKEGLTAEHYDVGVERTGHGGMSRGTTEAFDLVLLDLALPGASDLLSSRPRETAQGGSLFGGVACDILRRSQRTGHGA